MFKKQVEIVYAPLYLTTWGFRRSLGCFLSAKKNERRRTTTRRRRRRRVEKLAAVQTSAVPNDWVQLMKPLFEPTTALPKTHSKNELYLICSTAG